MGVSYAAGDVADVTVGGIGTVVSFLLIPWSLRMLRDARRHHRFSAHQVELLALLARRGCGNDGCTRCPKSQSQPDSRTASSTHLLTLATVAMVIAGAAFVVVQTEWGQTPSTSRAAVSTDGRTLATVDTGSSRVRFWSIDSGRSVGPSVTELIRTPGDLPAPAATPGTDIFPVLDNGSLQMWDLGRRARIGEPIPLPDGYTDFAVSPDGRLLAIAANAVFIWDLQTHQTMGEPISAGTRIWFVNFTPDSRGLFTSDEEGIAMWDVEQRVIVGEPIPCAAIAACHITVSIDGLLAYGAGDGIVLWNIASKTTTAVLNGTSAMRWLTFSPTDQIAAIAMGNEIGLWDTRTGDRIGTLTSTSKASHYRTAVFGLGGRTVIAVGDSGIAMWTLSDGTQTHTFRIGWNP
jgi:WD40 repeat protein